MYKILFIVSTLEHSGTTIQIFNIAKYLDKKRFEIHALALSPAKIASITSNFKNIGVQTHCLNLSRIKGVFSGKSKLEKMVDDIQPDLIHTQGFRSDGFSVSLARRYILVSSIQNYPFYDYPMLYGKIRGYLMASKHLAVIRDRQNFIACSRSVADEFMSRNDVKIDFIQNGVDIEIFHPADNELKEKYRKQLGLHLDQKIFVTVGVLIPRKDMETVIKAFQSLSNVECTLVILGDGEEMQNLENLVADSDTILLKGNVNNVHHYMKASDYFVSASWAEGLPNTVLEAMACSLPVILSEIGPHREVFDASIDYPYFFKIKDSAHLALLMEKMIADDNRRLSEQMLQIIEENFTAQVMSGRYQKLYDTLLQNKAKTD